MGADSKIEWTDATFNPVWGCTEVSPGCDNCYARTLAHRYKHDVWGLGNQRRLFGNAHWDEPRKWNERAKRIGKRLKVFCASMADWLDKDWPESVRERLILLIEDTPNLDWLLLTKRIGNVKKMVPARWLEEWPANAWLGISVVNQEEADRDIPKLLAVPARVRFLSCEPLLGPLDLEFLHSNPRQPGDLMNALTGARGQDGCTYYKTEPVQKLDWVIVGGESGPGARPMHPAWARSLRDQCKAHGVAFFMKQMTKKAPIPADLMVREFPEFRAIVARAREG